MTRKKSIGRLRNVIYFNFDKPGRYGIPRLEKEYGAENMAMEIKNAYKV